MQRSGHNRLQTSHDSHSPKLRQRRASLRASFLMRPNSAEEKLPLRFLSGGPFRLGLRMGSFLHCVAITYPECRMQNAELRIFRIRQSEFRNLRRGTDQSTLLPFFRRQWHRSPTPARSPHRRRQRRLSNWFPLFLGELVRFHPGWFQIL
jgi:hypothetical protein